MYDALQPIHMQGTHGIHKSLVILSFRHLGNP